MASPHLRSVSLAFLRNSLLSTTLHSASVRGSSKSCEERRGRRRKGRRRSRRGGEGREGGGGGEEEKEGKEEKRSAGTTLHMSGMWRHHALYRESTRSLPSPWVDFFLKIIKIK